MQPIIKFTQISSLGENSIVAPELYFISLRPLTISIMGVWEIFIFTCPVIIAGFELRNYPLVVLRGPRGC